MPQTILSLAKTTQPTLSIVLDRERLYKQFDGTPGKKALWIAGPPGAGKTTAIASYLRAREHAVLWYQLDSSDADVATFFHYLRRTALKHSTDSDADVPDLPSQIDNGIKFGRRLFRAVFTRFRKPLVIVFDNYDSVPPYSDLHAVLANAINEVPNHSLLVFVSRSDPSPVFAHARVSETLVAIDGANLTLNSEELIQLAQLRQPDISEDILNKILQASAGWFAGCILLLEYAKQTKAFKNGISGKSKNVLFEYVAEEIFSKFDDLTKEFLLKVCWPRRLTVKLAEVLGSVPAARQHLVNLACHNYFVTEREDTGECEYILHPLFRDFLQAQARRSLDESAIIEIQRTTADLLIEEGFPEEAVELLVTNLDWERLEPIITQHAALLIQQGRSSLLNQWLEELPRDRLNGNAWLLYWFGAVRQSQSPREARNYFEYAFRRFEGESKPDSKGLVLACCGVIEAIIAEIDDYSLLDGWSDKLTHLLTKQPNLSKQLETAHVTVILLIAFVLRNPKQSHLSEWVHRAHRSLRQAPHTECQQKDRLWFILACSLSGRFEIAGDLLVSFKHDAKAIEQPRQNCQYLLLSSLNDLFSGNARSSEPTASCLAWIEENSLNDLLPFAYACLCATAMTHYDLTNADNWLIKLSSVTSTGQRLPRFLNHYLSSWRALVANDNITAHHEQRQAQVCAIELGIPFLEVLSSTAFAQLLFLCGDSRGGTAQLRRVHSIAHDLQNPLLEFMTLIVYGEAAMREGKNSRGTNALRYALGLGRRHGFYHLPWWHPTQLADVLAIALTHKIEVDYVRDFIIRRNLQPNHSPIDIPDWPWPLTIKTFGGFQVTQLGHENANSGKRQGKPQQLLKILIALGGHEVSVATIAEILWPNVDRYYSDKSLTINLHRLRELLGNDKAILLRENCLSINAKLVWLDIWALEHLIGKIEASMLRVGNNYSTSKLENYSERLLGLYQGPFLGGDEMSCFNEARGKFDAQFIKAKKVLAGVGG